MKRLDLFKKEKKKTRYFFAFTQFMSSIFRKKSTNDFPILQTILWGKYLQLIGKNIRTEWLLSDKRQGRSHNQTKVEQGWTWSDIIAYRHLKQNRRTIKIAFQSQRFSLSVLSTLYKNCELFFSFLLLIALIIKNFYKFIYT